MQLGATHAVGQEIAPAAHPIVPPTESATPAITLDSPPTEPTLQVADPPPPPYPGYSVTRGVARTTIPTLFSCPLTINRAAAVGKIRSNDGRTWTVPGELAFVGGPKAVDIFNPCTGNVPESIDGADLSSLSVVEIDPDGEVITGYLFADNYFELYVNGKLVAVDSMPFTPFNSAVVRFRAKRPITYAVKLVDWEQNLGIGTETDVGIENHPGDGGFIATFSDGTVTDASWKAQTFYIAPLNKPNDVKQRGKVRDTSQLGRFYPEAPAEATCGLKCYARHYPVPKNWYSPKFRDGNWPQAFEYSEAQVGVSEQLAYTAFRDVFSSAKFIWSNNLVLDNLVLARKTVK